jgi:hypothetical protein
MNIFLFGWTLTKIFIGLAVYELLQEVMEKFTVENGIKPQSKTLNDVFAKYLMILLCGVPILGFLLIIIWAKAGYYMTTDNITPQIIKFKKDMLDLIKSRNTI